MSGIFIVFEGLDGSGKSTQINMLNKYLIPQYEVTCTREPGGHILSEQIRDYILSNTRNHLKDLLLFHTSRLINIEELIKPSLAKNKIVICDRFIDSSHVYQTMEGNIDEFVAKYLEINLFDDIKPNVSFLLDIEPSIALKRIKKRGELNNREDKEIELINKRRKWFIDRFKNKNNAYIINANNKAEKISQEIISIINSLIFNNK